MPRNVSGTYSPTAGQPVSSNTTVSSTVHNNLVADLGAEITDSLSRSGKGGMTAPIRTADGSVAAPAHSFTSETGTGLYRIGAGNPGLAVSGSKRQEWTSTGTVVTGTAEVTDDITADGNLDLAGDATVGGTLGVTGVATLTATPVLNAGASVPTGDITLTGGAGQSVIKTGADFYVGTGDARNLIFRTNNTNRFYIDNATGNLVLSGGTVTNLPTPSATSDAATKGFVDATDTAGSITVTTGWTTLAGGYKQLRKQGNGIVTLAISAQRTSGSSTVMATLPAGCRPASTMNLIGITDGAATNAIAALASDGTMTVTAPTVTNGHWYEFHVSFYGAN